MSFAIIRGSNGRRHEVDFKDDPVGSFRSWTRIWTGASRRASADLESLAGPHRVLQVLARLSGT